MKKLILKEHFKKVGTITKYSVNGLVIDVTIMDVRQSFGRIDYQVTPVRGAGAIWITAPENR